MHKAVATLIALPLALATAHAQTPGKGLPDKNGYIGYSDAFSMKFVDDALVHCADAGPAYSSNGIAAVGPLDADGWASHVDILRCDTRKRVLRIEKPNLRYGPEHDWRIHGVGAWQVLETGSGLIAHLRDGGWQMYDQRLKPVQVDPERTLLLGKGSAVRLTDTPGVFIPYLSDARLPALPEGMLGFQTLRTPNRWSPDYPHRETVEVWQTANGLKYGRCARERPNDASRRGPYCGPLYDEVQLHELTFNGEVFTKTSAAALLGLRNGKWEVAHSLRLDIGNSEWDRQYVPNLILPTTPADKATLSADNADELLVQAQGLFAAYMKLEDDKVERKVYPTMREVIQRYAAFEAEAARQRAVEEAARREAERQRIAQLRASDPTYCYRTDACQLGWAMRWQLAQNQNDYAASARIARESGWSSLLAQDILAARQRKDRSIWQELDIYATAANDPRLQNLLGDTWRQAQLVKGNRDAFEMRRDQEMDRAIRRNAPLNLPSYKPYQLSTLEEDYYVGRGYVKVPVGK